MTVRMEMEMDSGTLTQAMAQGWEAPGHTACPLWAANQKLFQRSPIQHTLQNSY